MLNLEPATALVAMTGYGQPEDRRRDLQAGFDTYLVKPVDPAELSRLLSELGQRGGAALAAQAMQQLGQPLDDREAPRTCCASSRSAQKRPRRHSGRCCAP
jgi:DNA-binding response OmpR family regulator